MSVCRLLTALSLLTLTLAACRDNRVTTYRIPKEKDPAPSAAADVAAAAGNDPAKAAATSAAALEWTAPSEWKAKPAAAMRRASYAVPGAAGTELDLSITSFGGPAGGELANVNRWRGQIQLAPITAPELSHATAEFDQNGLHFTVVDLVNPQNSPAQRIIGAIVPLQGETWFFKLTGDDRAVAGQRDAFNTFLHSVRPATGGALSASDAPMPAPASGPMPGPDSNMAKTAVPTADGPNLSWTAPVHWQAKPASATRKGSYAISGESGAEADVSITAFHGPTGGEVANLNRWRSQVQLPPLSESELATVITHLEQNGLHFTVADFAGPPGPLQQRVLAAIVPVGPATWFFKLIGPNALVAKEKPAFEAFLKTVKGP